MARRDLTTQELGHWYRDCLRTDPTLMPLIQTGLGLARAQQNDFVNACKIPAPTATNAAAIQAAQLKQTWVKRRLGRGRWPDLQSYRNDVQSANPPVTPPPANQQPPQPQNQTQNQPQARQQTQEKKGLWESIKSLGCGMQCCGCFALLMAVIFFIVVLIILGGFFGMFGFIDMDSINPEPIGAIIPGIQYALALI
ncbi:hypothetical protein ACFL0C_00155 [Patescibacteria group bacterium]